MPEDLQCLALVLAGRTYRQVATELSLPPQTVAITIRNTMQHIGRCAREFAGEAPLLGP